MSNHLSRTDLNREGLALHQLNLKSQALEEERYPWRQIIGKKAEEAEFKGVRRDLPRVNKLVKAESLTQMPNKLVLIITPAE